jgi:integrase
MKSSDFSQLTSSSDPINDLVNQVIKASPSLTSLTQSELTAVAKAVILDDLKEELRHRIDVARIDLAAQKDVFLARYSSPQTRRSYAIALDALEAWASRAGVMLLDFKPRHADAFIASCSGSPASIRLRVAAVSSFFTFLDRETEGRIRNPFLGTRLRPKRTSATPQVPSPTDVDHIIGAAQGDLKAACIAIIEHGFRVGALPSLQVWGQRFQGLSKGKQVSGVLTERAKNAVIEASLDARAPWQGISADSLRNRFQYLCRRLYAKHTIAAAYSIHDLRHYYAIQHYREYRDIYSLKLLLGHASIQVTEHYLRGLSSYL